MKIIPDYETELYVQLESNGSSPLEYASYSKKWKSVVLDGTFTVEELEAIVAFIKEQP